MPAAAAEAALVGKGLRASAPEARHPKSWAVTLTAASSSSTPRTAHACISASAREAHDGAGLRAAVRRPYLTSRHRPGHGYRPASCASWSGAPPSAR